MMLKSLPRQESVLWLAHSFANKLSEICQQYTKRHSYYSLILSSSTLKTVQVYSQLMRRSNCSAPIPPGHQFFLAAPVLLSLYFFLASPYINTLITLFCSAPPFFITHIFPLTPGQPGGMGANQFDRRITNTITGLEPKSANLFVI